MPSRPPLPALAHPPTHRSRAGPSAQRGHAGELAVAVVVALVATLITSGCGTPPELRAVQPSQSAQTTPATPSGTPTTVAAPPPVELPRPTAGSTPVAVRCPAGPSGQRVTDLVRGQDLLPGEAQVKVRTGPLCADDWHYTLLDVAGYEPLQVVSRGSGAAPRLVTAGTDVCTAEVRVTAPVGIRALVCDSGSGT